MIIVNTMAATRLRQQLDTLLLDVSKEIIEFQIRLLRRINPQSVETFLIFQQTYPNHTPGSPEIDECLRYLAPGHPDTSRA